jgi:hypothetical protein
MRYNAHVGVQGAKELYRAISTTTDPEELTEPQIKTRVEHLKKCDCCGEWNSNIFFYGTKCISC